MQIVHDLVSFLGVVCTQGPGRPRVSVDPGSRWAQGLSVGPGSRWAQGLSVGPGSLGGPRPSRWAQALSGPRVSWWAQGLSVDPGSWWAQGLGGPRVSETTVSLGLSPSQTILPHIVWE